MSETNLLKRGAFSAVCSGVNSFNPGAYQESEDPAERSKHRRPDGSGMCSGPPLFFHQCLCYPNSKLSQPSPKFGFNHIIAPLDIMSVWVKEFSKIYKPNDGLDLHFTVLHGTSDERLSTATIETLRLRIHGRQIHTMRNENIGLGSTTTFGRAKLEAAYRRISALSSPRRLSPMSITSHINLAGDIPGLMTLPHRPSVKGLRNKKNGKDLYRRSPACMGYYR